jgi:hypothetical protein
MIAPMKTPLLTLFLCAGAIGSAQAQSARSTAPVLVQASRSATAPSALAKAVAEVPAPTSYSVVERGANHRVFERLVYEKSPSGRIYAKPHRYTEIATGMHYKDAKGNWLESSEKILPSAQGGAEAVQGGHQVYFPYDIYDGAIRTVTPDGVHLRSRPLCISYFDGTKSCVVAELTHSVGEILPSGNQVIYKNAFTDFAADLLCTYRKGSFECDLIFREQPPGPEEFGLNPSTSRLELLTEFFDTRDPRQTSSSVRQKSGLADTTLEFGKMRMIRGKAFAVGGQSKQAGSRKTEIPVSKTWTHLEGRTFLIEEVPIQQIAPELQSLPAPSSSDQGLPAYGSGRRAGSASRVLPPSRLVQASTNSVHMAKADVSGRPGVALDYTMVENQDAYTFQGDTTYYVVGDVNISDATIEGGTVVKHDASGNSINILGTVSCLTAPYRPAVLTSCDDNTVGEGVSCQGAGSCTGTLTLDVVNDLDVDLVVYVWGDSLDCIVCGETVSAASYGEFVRNAGLGQHYTAYAYYDGYYYSEYWGSLWPTLQSGTLEVHAYGNVNYSESGDSLCTPPPPGSPAVALTLADGGTLHDLRICNADVGISSSGNYSVTNLQFVNCQKAMRMDDCSFYAGNVLMSRVSTAFYGENFQGRCEQLTFDQGTSLTDDPDGAATISTLALTNSLLTGVASFGVVPVSTNYVVTLATNLDVFQTCGGGAYYLANDTYRNAGTTNVDPGLLSQLRTKTTYPPIVYSNASIDTVTQLAPQPQRDTDTPDLGYHYYALDYVFGGCDFYANLTVSAGTAIGWFELPDTGGPGYGISIFDDVTATFNGTVSEPCTFARYDTVQEGGTGNWTDKGWLAGITGQGSGDPSHAAVTVADFTRFALLTGDPNHFRDNCDYFILRANNCEFWSGLIGAYHMGLNLTNCFVDRTEWMGAHSETASVAMQNCLMHGGVLGVEHWDGSTWPVSVVDCAFDGTDFTDMDAPSGGDPDVTHCNYNAFLAGAGRTSVHGIDDVIVTNFNWQTSWLGNFYLPTNSALIDHGSTSADQLGLYHYTTQTNQMKETNSIVDIGYHYVAVDANGNRIDTDSDGLPDYLEDSNGNGLVDSGETDWRNPDTSGDGMLDGWKVLWGLNPLVDNAAQPSIRANYSYNLTDWLDTISGVRSGVVDLDNEGNVLSVSQ